MTNFKPILFSTSMVQAILEGRKTQTRRITNDWDQNKPKFLISSQGMYADKYPKPAKYMAHFRYPNDSTDSVGLVAPIQPGDILWVRETFDYSDNLEEPFWYKEKYQKEYLPEVSAKVKWKPSIHMPKKAARIFLEVTSVRCERLNDISLSDCKLEGVTYYQQDNPDVDDILALEAFIKLWESINGKDSWIKNPFVWVYEFKMISKPVNWPSINA